MNQQFLNILASKDEIGFLRDVDNWSNHRPLLYLALSLTDDCNPPYTVIEFGSGNGSTAYLRKYCDKEVRRGFVSYESDSAWAAKVGMVMDISGLYNTWDNGKLYNLCSVAFIDHAPGEHRKVAIQKFKDLAHIIVVHDTELGGAGDYQLEPVLNSFEYRLNYNQSGGGAGATAVSNIIDLNLFRGLTLGTFKFDAS